MQSQARNPDSIAVYVGNVAFNATAEDVKTAFSKYGHIEYVHIPRSRETGKPRGFCFVYMNNASSVDAAVDGLNGKELFGRVITVNRAAPRPQRSNQAEE